MGFILQDSPLPELVASKKGGIKVFLGSLFEISGFKELMRLETVEFDSITDFANAGWMVE